MDVPKKVNVERDEIENYEREAQELELIEAQLLQQLQETQQKEKEAYGKLESVMVDTSVPLKHRLN